jgi:two-component system, LytTR family, sensor kinase
MTRPSRNLFWPLQIGGWLAFGVAMALSRVGRYPIDYMIATKLSLTAIGFVLSLGLWQVYRRLLRRDPSILQIVVATAVASYIVSLPWTAAYNLVDARIVAAFDGRPIAIDSVAKLLNGSIYHTFVLLAWSVFYFAIKHYERSLKAESLAHQARLQALRYQLNPHFLFNTLNAISTLVVDKRNAEAGKMIARLSDFLRMTLDRPDVEEVPLSDEIEFVRRYLEIEQVRFGDRLSVKIDVAEDAWTARVPVMVLQPLVENAIRHAVAPRAEGGRIEIGATIEDRGLRIWVADDGPGLNGNGNGNGIGLTNTRERLRQLYGSAHRFELRSANGGSTDRSPLPGLHVLIDLPHRV